MDVQKKKDASATAPRASFPVQAHTAVDTEDLFLATFGACDKLKVASLPPLRRAVYEHFHQRCTAQTEAEMKVDTAYHGQRRSRFIRAIRQKRSWHAVGVANNFVKNVCFRFFRRVGLALDLGCNHGQDVAKWKMVNPSRGVVFVDLVPACLRNCYQRWHAVHFPFPASFQQRDFCLPYTDFIKTPVRMLVADTNRKRGESRILTEDQVLDLGKETFDAVSAQFSGAYAFESKASAEHFLVTIATSLSPRGRALMSLPDGDLLRRLFIEAAEGKAPGATAIARAGMAVLAFTVVPPGPKAYLTGTPYTFTWAGENDQAGEADGFDDAPVRQFLIEGYVFRDLCRKHGLYIAFNEGFDSILKQEAYGARNRKLKDRMKLEDLDLDDADLLASVQLYRMYALQKHPGRLNLNPPPAKRDKDRN